jgi:hypothetical protein
MSAPLCAVVGLTCESFGPAPYRSRQCVPSLRGDDPYPFDPDRLVVRHRAGVDDHGDLLGGFGIVLLVPADAATKLVQVVLVDRLGDATRLQLDHRMPAAAEDPPARCRGSRPQIRAARATDLRALPLHDPVRARPPGLDPHARSDRQGPALGTASPAGPPVPMSGLRLLQDQRKSGFGAVHRARGGSDGQAGLGEAAVYEMGAVLDVP